MPTKPSEKTDQIELRPDGWDRFKKAVHAAAKSGPKHRTKDTESVVQIEQKD